MNRPPLFKNDFYNEQRPKNFCFLIRPTLKEYNDFILLLDKLISENINKKFFQDDIPLEYYVKRKDGKVIIRHKNTITILEEWLKTMFKTAEGDPIKKMKSVFKEIRSLRQKPAHAIDENKFNQKYIKEQREIMIKAYEGIQIIRLIFMKHPKVKDFQIPEILKTGPIWTM